MITFENDRRTRAEQHVIASLLRKPDMLRHCPHLTPRDFSHELHGAAYRAITVLVRQGKPVDVLSVFYEITRSLKARFPRYRSCSLTGRSPVLGYLLSLEGCGVVPSHVGYYTAVMLDPSCNREERYVVVM